MFHIFSGCLTVPSCLGLMQQLAQCLAAAVCPASAAWCSAVWPATVHPKEVLLQNDQVGFFWFFWEWNLQNSVNNQNFPILPLRLLFRGYPRFSDTIKWGSSHMNNPRIYVLAPPMNGKMSLWLSSSQISVDIQPPHPLPAWSAWLGAPFT